VAALFRAIRAVVRTNAPIIHQGGVAVQEVQLHVIESQAGKPPVHCHGLRRQPAHAPKALDDGSTGCHQPGGVVMRLDRTLDVGQSGLHADLAWIDFKRKSAADCVVCFFLEWVGDHRASREGSRDSRESNMTALSREAIGRRSKSLVASWVYDNRMAI